jgi:hypothetical protein
LRRPAQPMISLFLFALSWAVYAAVFCAATQIMPAFHSDYREATLAIAFLIGFINAMFVKLMRWLRFSLNLAVLAVIAFFLDWILVKVTGGGGPEGSYGNYYVTGNAAPVIVGLLLACTLVVVETIKKKLVLDR